jgi:hypothetical protein
MLTKEEAHARVARGAAYLDRIRPGWYARVNVTRLELWNCSQCVIGQLYVDFWVGTKRLWNRGIEATRDADSPEVRYGFALETANLCEYHALQDAWIEAIADRCLPPRPGAPLSLDAVHESRESPELTPRVRIAWTVVALVALVQFLGGLYIWWA